jgi:hypothetical protein
MIEYCQLALALLSTPVSLASRRGGVKQICDIFTFALQLLLYSQPTFLSMYIITRAGIQS